MQTALRVVFPVGSLRYYGRLYPGNLAGIGETMVVAIAAGMQPTSHGIRLSRRPP